GVVGGGDEGLGLLRYEFFHGWTTDQVLGLSPLCHHQRSLQRCRHLQHLVGVGGREQAATSRGHGSLERVRVRLCFLGRESTSFPLATLGLADDGHELINLFSVGGVAVKLKQPSVKRALHFLISQHGSLLRSSRGRG